MQLGKPKRSLWEKTFISLLVVSGLFLSVAIYAKWDFLCKAKLLRLELLTLRNGVITQLLENKKVPEKIKLPPADPFGNRYQYNSKTGWVSSTTEQVEGW